ncbi:hypothetical protein HBO43_22330 [Pseudomonas veronii]|uniref:Uncharacterized protein n=1 Tax=Pseudomonas veronii TaxID=76761 RepID=A0A7Y0ZWK5_PSEVE|nr:hypothetical protein [Pseudomonas veronii]NMX99331.1 hypothetical protein [Pseudomonas veronii]
MPGETPPNQPDPVSATELPPLDFEFKPEQPATHSQTVEVDEVGIDLRVHLDAYIVKRQQAEIDELGQTKIEREQLHVLRTTSTRKLFILTVVWLSVIWLVVFLQGFGQWFFPHPAPASDEAYLKFHLSDSVMIAFITSTTATVLGLYGIAAYWLYGKKLPIADEKKKKTEQEKNKEKKQEDTD